jgi:lysyl-tRNA synthetase class II
MEMVNSMIGTTENIMASYNLRVKSLGDLMIDTHRALTGFAAERKKMAKQQAETLSGFGKDLSETVEEMLNEFHESHQQMSEEQKKNLTHFIKGLASDVSSILSGFEKDRGKMSKELRQRLTKEVKEIETYIEKRLKEFNEAHTEMKEKQKKDLIEFMGKIKKTVTRLLGECRRHMTDLRKDLDKASQAWKGMTVTLARTRKNGWGGNKIGGQEQPPNSERTTQAKRGYKTRKGPRGKRTEATS